jgi:hypothetical protein
MIVGGESGAGARPIKKIGSSPSEINAAKTKSPFSSNNGEASAKPKPAAA